MSVDRERASVEDEPYGTPESRIPDILALTEGNLPIRIDEFNERIVRVGRTCLAFNVDCNS